MSFAPLTDLATGRSSAWTASNKVAFTTSVAPSIAAHGATITTGSSSASSPIPDTAAGTAPSYVRLAATQACYVRFGEPSEATAVMAVAGTGYINGDVLTVVGGTYTTAMQLTVASTKLISAVGDALGSGYNVNDVITLAGGTPLIKATITLSHVQLASATQGAIGSGYSAGDVITTTGSSAVGTQAHLTVGTIKLATLALNAPGTGMHSGDILTMVGGTHAVGDAAKILVTETELESAAVNVRGTGYAPGNVLTAVGGTTADAATFTLVSTRLNTIGSLSAAGTGYIPTEVITTNLSDGTATTATKVRIDKTKLISINTTPATPGTGYAINQVLTLLGGTQTTAATVTVTHASAITAVPNAAGTIYVPGDTITPGDGTFGIAAVLTVSHTKVVSATPAAAGDSGINGPAVVTGTTGAGTKFTANVTITANAIASVDSIATGGAYTTNPTDIVNEPVTGGNLNNAVLTVVMGVQAVTVSTPGDYTVAPATMAQAGGSTTSAAGTGATFNTISYGALTVSLTNAGKFTANEATTFTVAAGGATFDTPVYGVSAGDTTITQFGIYTTNATTLTQATTTGSGSGVVFGTLDFGVNTWTLAKGTYTGTESATLTSSGAGNNDATFNMATYGVKTTAYTGTGTSRGSYTDTTAVTTFTSTGGGGDATFQTVLFGVNTWSYTTRGDYTVIGTDVSQASASPANGTGATWTTPLFAPLTWTYSNAGGYSATSTTLTQFGTVTSGGTGATFKTAAYGVKTVTVSNPGAYTVDPTNDVATTGGSGDAAAAFTITMLTTATAGDLLVQPGDAIIVPVAGYDHIAALQVTAAGVLQIQPLEN